MNNFLVLKLFKKNSVPHLLGPKWDKCSGCWWKSLTKIWSASKIKLTILLLMSNSTIYCQGNWSIAASNKLKIKTYFFPRYANDVIAKCAFGVTVNSMKDENNEFYEMGAKFLQFNRKATFKFFLFSSIPKIMKVKISHIPSENIFLTILLIFSS